MSVSPLPRTCWLCGKPVDLEDCKIDDHGLPVHESCYLVKVTEMKDDFSQQDWVRVYQSAFMELKHALMAGRIADTRAAIVKRLEVLQAMPGLHSEERQAIADARNTLLTLEQETVKHEATQQRAFAQEAFDKLDSIAPAIERLKSESAE